MTINQPAEVVMETAGKHLRIVHVPGPLGVRGRNSDNRLIRERLEWSPSEPLRDGIKMTYAWTESQVRAVSEVVAA